MQRLFFFVCVCDSFFFSSSTFFFLFPALGRRRYQQRSWSDTTTSTTTSTAARKTSSVDTEEFREEEKKRAPEKNATFLFNRFCFSFFFRFGVGCCRQRSPSDTTATAAVVVPKCVKKGEKKVTFPLRSSAQFDVDGRRRSTRISTTRTARPKKTKRKTNGRDAKGQRKRTPVMKEEHKRKTKKEPAKSINFN